MMPTPGCPDDDDFRRALVDRLVAWKMLKRYRKPIRCYSPAVRRTIEETSARFRAAKRTIMDALELSGGRWVDPSNPIELVLHPDGDGFLMLAPGVIRPERWLVRAADRVNAMRFGPAGPERSCRTKRDGLSSARRPSRNGLYIAATRPSGGGET